MEVPRLGVKSELQLLAYAIATATWDPSHTCDLYHRSRQSWIPNPLGVARDRTCVLMDTGQVYTAEPYGIPRKSISHILIFDSPVL